MREPDRVYDRSQQEILRIGGGCPEAGIYHGDQDHYEAKKILIVASGEDKAEIVQKAFFGPITPQVPASVLQLHNDVTLVADEAALSKLSE